jgi:hypothetical protein
MSFFATHLAGFGALGTSFFPPDYANAGGTGDRTATITATASAAYEASQSGSIVNLVDGAIATGATDAWATLAVAVSGNFMRFDFGAGASKLITEAKWYQNTTATSGDHVWQGSDDATNWTNIGATFTLGGATTQTITELSGNTTGYRYYQLLGVSGNLSAVTWHEEMEFKIS